MTDILREELNKMFASVAENQRRQISPLTPDQWGWELNTFLALFQKTLEQRVERVKVQLGQYKGGAYHTKNPVLWKPTQPEGNKEHYDTGFNEALDLCLAALSSGFPEIVIVKPLKGVLFCELFQLVDESSH